jgi:hypothetical protein
MRLVVFFFSTIFLLLCVSSSCLAFRCGGEPIGLWDSKEKVSRYCGTSNQRGSDNVYHQGRTVYAETWYYNCGESDFVYAVSFYNGVVIKEEPIRRGSGKSQCGKK